MWEWGGVVNFSWWDAAELVTFLFRDTVEFATRTRHLTKMLPMLPV